MSAELKPCPFCGGKAISAAQMQGSPAIAVCITLGCAAEIPARTEAEAITAWNTRASEARIAQLEGHLSYYAETFCELGTSHECCGRLTDDDCSGCRARTALNAGGGDE